MMMCNIFILALLLPQFASAYTNFHNFVGFTKIEQNKQPSVHNRLYEKRSRAITTFPSFYHSPPSLLILNNQLDPYENNDENNDKQNSNRNNNSESNSSTSILSRFTSPRISDPGLPLADALIAQIVAPSLQVFWLILRSAPSPTWLQPLFPTAQLFTTRGSLVAPTLIHGAELTVCWLLASLAAKGFESEAFDVSENKGYGEVILRLFKAGAFAVGLLVLATQMDLFLEFGRYVQYGDAEESDLRILVATIEVINDCIFEGVALGSWRLYRASLTADEV